MYVAVIPNRGSPPAILLRESYRQAGKTKNRTLANLSRWPAERIEQLRAVLRGDKLLPAAKLATVRMLDPATASHSLGEMLGLGKVAAKEVYGALDWLGREQPFIEAKLARRHLQDGALLLYDVTSTYLEGRCCELE